MSVWLRGFARRATLSVGIFFAAGLAALAIASVTVGFQAFRAARTNPADSLRRE